LNVANFIVMRVSGVDSYELATQFDNTPPLPEIEYQPKRIPSRIDPQYFDRAAVDIAVPGKPRPYSDVAAERANGLAGMPNYTALCRIVEDGRLVEHEIAIEPIAAKKNDECAATIRQASLGYGTNVRDVASAIRERIGSSITFDYLIPHPDDED
jgi:hypothetical protein